MRLRKSLPLHNSKRERGEWYVCSFCGFILHKSYAKSSNVVYEEGGSYGVYLVDSSDNKFYTDNIDFLTVETVTIYNAISYGGCPLCGAEIRI